MYWPAFLMGAGVEVPRRVVAHGHWTVDRVKVGAGAKLGPGLNHCFSCAGVMGDRQLLMIRVRLLSLFSAETGE